MRPIDPQRFNGTVIVYWQNVTVGYELGSVTEGEYLRGYAWVGVSAQKVGIDGFPNWLSYPPAYDAAIRHMHNWLTQGTPPPTAPPIEMSAEPAKIKRDAHGNALPRGRCRGAMGAKAGLRTRPRSCSRGPAAGCA